MFTTTSTANGKATLIPVSLPQHPHPEVKAEMTMFVPNTKLELPAFPQHPVPVPVPISVIQQPVPQQQIHGYATVATAVPTVQQTTQHVVTNQDKINSVLKTLQPIPIAAISTSGAQTAGTQQQQTNSNNNHTGTRITTANGKTEYVCNACGLTCPKQHVLKQHIKSVHDKIRDQKCTYCNYAATRVSLLKVSKSIFIP